MYIYTCIYSIYIYIIYIVYIVYMSIKGKKKSKFKLLNLNL